MKISLTIILLLILGLSVSGQTQAIVVVPQTTLHESADSKAKVTSTVQKGDKLNLENETIKNGWYYVSVLKGDLSGWISSDTIKLSPVTKDNQAERLKEEKEEEWRLMIYTVIGDYYYRTTDVKEIDNGVFQYWTKVTFKPEGDAQQSLNEISCKSKQIRNLRLLYINSEGKIGRETLLNEPFKQVTTNTFGEKVLKRICALFWKL
jgi:uncharacterized protein YgiM (DUF1202 family)